MGKDFGLNFSSLCATNAGTNVECQNVRQWRTVKDCIKLQYLCALTDLNVPNRTNGIDAANPDDIFGDRIPVHIGERGARVF